MVSLLNDVSLKSFNTFGMDVRAAWFAEVYEIEDLRQLLRNPELKKMLLLVLGGGSNILFTRDFNGLVIINRLKGIETIAETEDKVLVKSASGEIWHEFVKFCIAEGYGGVENLSLIPGTVGAAPIQNIGAYGAELKDVFYSLEALDLETLIIHTFQNEECRFGYRDSIFKREAKGKYFITSVSFELTRHPKVNTAYGAIHSVLKERGIDHPGIADVSEAVCSIRRSKLPDPNIIGNAGSFFKNPEIPQVQYDRLKEKFPDIPGYSTAHGIKVPAGWLIEYMGWKGKRIGETGSHKDQALVLVNYGNAKGTEVFQLAMDIQKSVFLEFGIHIEPEVNVL